MCATTPVEYHITPSPHHSSPVTLSYSALPFPFCRFSFPCFFAAPSAQHSPLLAPRPRFSSSFRLHPCPSLLRLIQIEHLVQLPHRQLHVLLVDHHGDLDLGSGNHLDVDTRFRQRAEHLACHTHVR